MGNPIISRPIGTRNNEILVFPGPRSNNDNRGHVITHDDNNNDNTKA